MLYSKAGPRAGLGRRGFKLLLSLWGGEGGALEAGPRDAPQSRAVGGAELVRRGFEKLHEAEPGVGRSLEGGALSCSIRQSRGRGEILEAGLRALVCRGAGLWRRGLEMPLNKAEPWAGRNSG